MQELWCEVLGSTAECCLCQYSLHNVRGKVPTVGLVFVLHVQLTQAKVAKRDMASVIEENVLGLQVTVDDVESVETLECTK